MSISSGAQGQAMNEKVLQEIKEELAEMRSSLNELRDWRISTSVESKYSKKEYETLHNDMRSLSREIRETREALLQIDNRFVSREEFNSHAEKLAHLMDKLNDKIVKGDERVATDTRKLLFKMISLSMTVMSLIIAAVKLFV